jgi:hypothetical protein
MFPLLHWMDSLSSASFPTIPKQRTDRFVNKRPLDTSPRSFLQIACSPSIVMLASLSQTEQNLSHVHRPTISAGSCACDFASEAKTRSTAEGPNRVLRITSFLSLRAAFLLSTKYPESPLRVRCRRAEEAAITVGIPQKPVDFAAMPQSAGAGQHRTPHQFVGAQQKSAPSYLPRWSRRSGVRWRECKPSATASGVGA